VERNATGVCFAAATSAVADGKTASDDAVAIETDELLNCGTIRSSFPGSVKPKLLTLPWSPRFGAGLSLFAGSFCSGSAENGVEIE
jgi:hypothetical protein